MRFCARAPRRKKVCVVCFRRGSRRALNRCCASRRRLRWRKQGPVRIGPRVREEHRQVLFDGILRAAQRARQLAHRYARLIAAFRLLANSFSFGFFWFFCFFSVAQQQHQPQRQAPRTVRAARAARQSVTATMNAAQTTFATCRAATTSRSASWCAPLGAPFAHRRCALCAPH